MSERAIKRIKAIEAGTAALLLGLAACSSPPAGDRDNAADGAEVADTVAAPGNDAEAVLRSLPSLPLRYRAHDEAARQLARWCEGRDEIVQVLHPALEKSPGHANWRALCGPDGVAAGLFSIVFDARHAPAQVDAFCDALKLFKLGYSWGGPVSLVVPYDVASMRHPRLGTWPHKGVLVRFSVGLEAVDDLRADLEQALRALSLR